MNRVTQKRKTKVAASLRLTALSWLFFVLPSCETVAPMSAKIAPPKRDSYEATAIPALEVRDSLLQLFDDPELGKVVDQTLKCNPDLNRTRARFEELGYNLAQTKGQLFPMITGMFTTSRSKMPTPALGGVGGGGFGAPGIPGGLGGFGSGVQGFHQLGLDASWEIDVWGKLRSGVSAAEADYMGAEADYEAIRQSLAAQTMQAWFSLVRATKIADLNRRQSESFELTFQLVERRFDLGLASLGELKLAETDFKNAEADILSSKNLRDQAARQLRLLTGCYPDKALKASKWPSLKRTVPECLPSDLICRRPDIVSAFHAVQAADARTDVAHKELFPTFNLTSSGGRQSQELSDLFKDGFSYWSITKNITAPIFNAGQLRNELRASGKRAEQAFFDYQSIVLNALLEVEDALGSEYYLAKEEKARLEALKSSQLALERTRRDYEEGISDLLTLLQTQRLTFNTEQLTIELRFNRLNNRVALALALGHGT